MYEESQFKQQAQTKQYADACAQANYAPAQGLCGRPATLAEQLDKSAEGTYNEGAKLSRAASILRQHPEYEDLIWLIRSGLV